MPDDESAEVGVRRGQSGLIVASAASVVVVVALVALVVHPWSATAARSVAAVASTPATSSDSPLASPLPSLPAVSVTEPAVSAAPASSPAATDGPSTAPAPTPRATRRTTTPAPRVAGDNQPNFKVSVQVSPTQVVVGHDVRVTVTIVNVGGLFDRSVVMTFGGSDPSDTFGDASAPCTDGSGSVTCPITGASPGRTWSFTFTFIPGPFPGTDGYVDAISALFDYIDSHGQPQQSPQYFANVRLFDASTTSPPVSGAPSDTPSPSASGASTTATPAPQSAG
jgi:hypothetical protein